jgi:hypothetical protein
MYNFLDPLKTIVAKFPLPALNLRLKYTGGIV